MAKIHTFINLAQACNIFAANEKKKGKKKKNVEIMLSIQCFSIISQLEMIHISNGYLLINSLSWF